jgi:hypothetical protein
VFETRQSINYGLVHQHADTLGQHREMSSFELNREALQRFRKKTFIDQDQDFADRIGVSSSTVSRVLAGESKPGAPFVAGTLQLFGDIWFTELFRSVR